MLDKDKMKGRKDEVGKTHGHSDPRAMRSENRGGLYALFPPSWAWAYLEKLWSSCFAGDDFENRRDTMFAITTRKKNRSICPLTLESKKKGKRCHI